MRGRGLARSKKASLGTWEGRGPLFNRRGRHNPNLLAGRGLPSFVLARTGRARARGGLRVEGVDNVIRVEVAGREEVEVVPLLSELAGFVGVGNSLAYFSGSPMSCQVSYRRMVGGIWVLSRGWVQGGGCSGPFFTLLRGRGARGCRRWWGLVRGGRLMVEGRDGG